MRRLALSPLLLALAPLLSAADRPVPTADAAARMTVPEGFRVTLFAGEPDVVQPIAFTFDDRGRMWVVECLSYPKWSQDGKGRDRVIILEDTDGDGVHDRKTVFLDNGVNLSGIELGFGGVWLCSSPNLIFIPAKNDQPAGPPEVVLDGWNVKDTKHNVFNSLGWGPDGWLYGCNGIQAKAWVGKPGAAQKDRTYLDCGVWRYHPTRKVFEVVAHGTTNPWGLDWDDYGEMFITNCVIDHLWHVVPGGHYQRMYGQDANPFVYGLMGPCSDHKHWGGGHWTESRADQKTGAVQKAHDDAGGGHAHSGCVVYLGDNFPAEYRNSVFTCNIHGNRLNRDTLHREGGGYVGRHAPDFLLANDPWFRGICVKQGPEGALYVSDWCDTGECHNYDKADTSNGRIYRVAYGSPRQFRGDVAAMSDAELVAMQSSKNEWLVRQARRVLQERSAKAELDRNTTTPLRTVLNGKEKLPRRLRAFWCLEATGSLDREQFRKLFADDEPVVRGWAYRLAFETDTRARDLLIDLGGALANEKDLFALGCAASAAQRVEPIRRHTITTRLVYMAETARDPQLELMVWYAVQPWFERVANGVPRYLPMITSPVVRRHAVRFFMERQLDTHPRFFGDLFAAASKSDKPALQLEILRGVREGLVGRKDSPPVPPEWAPTFAKLGRSGDRDVRREAYAVALLFGDAEAARALTRAATDAGERAEDRRVAIELLLTRSPPGFVQTLRGLLSDPAVCRTAVRALAAYPDAETPAAILKAYPSFTADEKADAIQTLASRPTFAVALLDAVEKGTVPKADVTVFTARQILALNDKSVAAKLERVWGSIRPASETWAAQTAKLKQTLTPDSLKAADLANGRAVFTRSCASCHKLFGEGGDVGPELTGSQRTNLDYVLENVLDPSAVVPGEYRMTALTLADGRVLTGIIRRETKQAVTVRTVNEEVTVPIGEIEARKQTPHSVMPDGLLDVLTANELRDLVAYLASPRQVPLPAGGQ